MNYNKLFEDIVYIDEGHRYFNLITGKELTAVTKYKKRFEPEFKRDFWLKRKSEELGIPIKELEADWNLKAKIGQDRGTLLHNYLENRFQRKIVKPNVPDYISKKEIEKLIFLADRYYKECTLEVLNLETVIGNTVVGGTSDKLLETNLIRDYKTGKLKEGYNKLKAPYQFLTDSSLDLYALQLNIYRHLYEARGVEISGMEIVFFNEDNDDYQIYDMPKFEIIL